MQSEKMLEKLSRLLELKRQQIEAARRSAVLGDRPGDLLTPAEAVEIWRVLHTESFRWELAQAELEVWEEIHRMLTPLPGSPG